MRIYDLYNNRNHMGLQEVIMAYGFEICSLWCKQRKYLERYKDNPSKKVTNKFLKKYYKLQTRIHYYIL
jgi:hypothetical protein